MKKKIEKLQLRHFSEKIIEGTRVPARDMLTDEDVLKKINEIIDAVNKINSHYLFSDL